jgi:hypothetical protein
MHLNKFLLSGLQKWKTDVGGKQIPEIVLCSKKKLEVVWDL